MTELLSTLIQYLWIVDFATFCILGALTLRQNQNTSSLMTVGIAIIISGTIINYEVLVASFVAPATNQNVFLLWGFGFIVVDSLFAYALYRLYHWLKTKSDSIVAPRSCVFFSIAFAGTVIVAQYSTLAFEHGGTPYKVWVILAHHLGSCIFYGLAIFAITKAHEASGIKHTLIARTYILAFSATGVIQALRLNEKFFFQTNYLADFYKWGLVSINISTTGVVLTVALLGVFQQITESEREGWLWTL